MATNTNASSATNTHSTERILLTEAHTFIGYRVLLSLLQAGYNVRAIFPLGLYRSVNLTEYHHQLQIIPNEYWAILKVSKAHLDGITAVVHIDYPPPIRPQAFAELVQKQIVYNLMINPMVTPFKRLLQVANDTESVKAVVLISSAISISDFKAGGDFPCEDKDYNKPYVGKPPCELPEVELPLKTWMEASWMCAYKTREIYRFFRHTGVINRELREEVSNLQPGPILNDDKTREAREAIVAKQRRRKAPLLISLLPTIVIGPDIRPRQLHRYYYPIDGNGVIISILDGVKCQTAVPSGAVHVEDVARIVVDCLGVAFGGPCPTITHYEHILTCDSNFDWNSVNTIAKRCPFITDGRNRLPKLGGSVTTRRWNVSMSSQFGHMKSFEHSVEGMVRDLVSNLSAAARATG